MSESLPGYHTLTLSTYQNHSATLNNHLITFVNQFINLRQVQPSSKF